MHGATMQQKEYENRFDSYATYQTNLTIFPFRKGQVVNQEEELFFVHTTCLMALHEQVLEYSKKIQAAIDQLPSFAVEPYFQKLIINEAQSNNEIEGVRSTKEELSNVLEHIHDTKNAMQNRFLGFMKTYNYIDQLEPFHKVEDFRKLYDELVADEIVKKKAPDGELFRKSGVTITDGSRITHRGVESESKIILKLNELIQFLKSEEVPDLYKYFIAHYYYEYIHPFYDGNGRTGRLFVGSYVSRKLERYSAITFSYAINNDKPKYYKALEAIADSFNKGDMTFYLKDMLELLIAGQKELLEDLQMVLAKSNRMKGFMEKLDWVTDLDVQKLLHSMLHIAALSNSATPLTNAQFMKILDLSNHRMNKAMEELEERDVVELVKKRPKTYKVKDAFMELIFNWSYS